MQLVDDAIVDQPAYKILNSVCVHMPLSIELIAKRVDAVEKGCYDETLGSLILGSLVTS